MSNYPEDSLSTAAQVSCIVQQPEVLVRKKLHHDESRTPLSKCRGKPVFGLHNIPTCDMDSQLRISPPRMTLTTTESAKECQAIRDDRSEASTIQLLLHKQPFQEAPGRFGRSTKLCMPVLFCFVAPNMTSLISDRYSGVVVKNCLSSMNSNQPQHE